MSAIEGPGIPVSWPTSRRVVVADGGAELSFEFADLVAYSGPGSLGGVALAFMALACGLPTLGIDGRAADRRTLAVDTAFDGPGARDGFELVTRAVTGGRYRVTPELAGPDAPEAPQGHFVFALRSPDAGVELVLRPGMVSAEFVAMVCRSDRSIQDETLLAQMKLDLARFLLGHEPEQVFHSRPIRGELAP
ncbi:MAG: hypothetical protein ACT4OS_05220 [Acidimicrobiales bacterium]